MLTALAAALDGTGPAILPLDPGPAGAALARMLGLFAPAAIVTEKGTWPLDRPAAGQAGAAAGIRDDTAVVIATSGSTGAPKAVELSAAALTASASASLARIGAGPGERWLCCLPVFHIAGIGVLVRSLITGLDPVVAASVSPDVLSLQRAARTFRWYQLSCAGCWMPGPDPARRKLSCSAARPRPPICSPRHATLAGGC